MEGLMDYEMLRDYALSMSETIECFPFDNETAVFKVCGKMFALVSLERRPMRLNLKALPEVAVELRERHEAITEGYHMNKKHWISIELDGTLSNSFIKELIKQSYVLAVQGLKKNDRCRILQSPSGA
jgi:predicted DNA-binding protein (MmcQ/YjbR family)